MKWSYPENVMSNFQTFFTKMELKEQNGTESHLENSKKSVSKFWPNWSISICWVFSHIYAILYDSAKPHFTSSFVVMSHESNTFSISASFAFSWSCWHGLTHAKTHLHQTQNRHYFHVMSQSSRKWGVDQLSKNFKVSTDTLHKMLKFWNLADGFLQLIWKRAGLDQTKSSS